MAIRFDELLDDDEAAVIDPRDIFLTLNRDKKFAFPRDIQTEVMKAWFGQRNNPDTVVKLNVGSGKTLVGLKKRRPLPAMPVMARKTLRAPRVRLRGSFTADKMLAL